MTGRPACHIGSALVLHHGANMLENAQAIYPEFVLKRIFTALTALFLATSAQAGWVFLEQDNTAGSGTICSFGYEEPDRGFMIWADRASVIVALFDGSWSLADDFTGWAGFQLNDKNISFELQAMNATTAFSPLEEDKWIRIIAHFAEDKSGTLVTPMAKVWMLPSGAKTSTANWIRCITENAS